MKLPKPDACRGCPAYGDGMGFVPDEMRESDLVVVGQNPGENEEDGRRYCGNDQYESFHPAPFIGKTGYMLSSYLNLAAKNRDEVSLANALRCRWGQTNKLPPVKNASLQQAIQHCTQAHWKRPVTARLVVAMGEYAFYAMTGLIHNFSQWRGYVVPYAPPPDNTRVPITGIWTPSESELPVLATYHLAYLFREPEAELPSKRDWNKVISILNHRWPESYPGHTHRLPTMLPGIISFDTEFTPNGRLVRYSIASEHRDVWVIEGMQPIPLPLGATVILQNAVVDLPYLRRLVGEDQFQSLVFHDTMYAHAVLHTGAVETGEQKGTGGGAVSHSLNFLGSIYGRLNRWKHLMSITPKTYSGADALSTMDAWSTGFHGGLLGELNRNPSSYRVYRELTQPLIRIILKAKEKGIKTNPDRARAVLKLIEREQQMAITKAQAVSGWPINIRSPKQVAFQLRKEHVL